MARILITGATGHIGAQLVAHFTQRGHDVVRMGTSPRDDGVVVADLSVWDPSWTRHFQGVDCVISLAACPRPDAGWSEIQRLNLDLAANVYEAASQAGVPRVVFASSNWVVAGHRFNEQIVLDSNVEPAPVNAYGMSKLAGERLGRLYSQARGMSVVCLRIGFNQKREGNPPGEHMSGGLWGQRMWLSDRDMCEGFERAAFAPSTLDFAVVNLVSDNAGMAWDLSEAWKLIGYDPQDGSMPVATREVLQRDARAKDLRDEIKRLERILAQERL